MYILECKKETNSYTQTEKIMEQQSFNDNWPQAKEGLQKKYPHLTTEDFIYETGNRSALKRVGFV